MIDFKALDFGQLVRSVWGQHISDEAVDDLLWGTTPYPTTGSPDVIRERLVEYHTRSNGNITEALKLAIDDIDAALLKSYADAHGVD